jgi:hypothetical protein
LEISGAFVKTVVFLDALKNCAFYMPFSHKGGGLLLIFEIFLPVDNTSISCKKFFPHFTVRFVFPPQISSN